MTKHTKLTKGKFSASFTLKDSIHLWNEISNILNSVNGAKKDWKGWCKCWHDFQSRSKKKHGVIMKSMASTGGGTQETDVLTPQEEQVLDMMCPTSITGHLDIPESTVTLVDDADNNDDIMQMEVEFLDEYEDSDTSNIPHDTLKSNDINISASQNINAMLRNKHNNCKEVLIEKENRNQIKNSNAHIEQDKCVEDFQKNDNTLKDSNARIQKAKNEKTNNTNSGKEKKISKKDLKNTIEISTKLNNVHAQTYELKRDYYNVKLEYLRRLVETHEKLAGVTQPVTKK
ncbi:uncharacterized protein LOC143898560 isoform X4 [Temnothorax americanus]